jgi:aminoglycoside phosphotransferase (APT) family kinase protein
VLREVHGARRAGAGGLWWWRAPARSLAAYREGRVRDAEAALAGTPDAGLPRRLAAGPAPPGDGFALLHGDLVAANVLWPPGGGPVLIDWEFHRMGDPAEDLAYLAELNGLPDAVLAAVLEGHGTPGLGGRVEGWRGLAAADAGAWYLAQGMGDEARRMLARARGRAAAG